MAINLNPVLTTWQDNPPSDLAKYAEYLDIQDDNGNTLLHLVLRALEAPNLDLIINRNLLAILNNLNQVGYNYFIRNNQGQTAYTLMESNRIHSSRLNDFNREHTAYLASQGEYFPDINRIVTQDWRDLANVEFLSARTWPLDDKRIYKISPNGPTLSIYDILVRTGQIEKLRALILMKEAALASPYQPQAYVELTDDEAQRKVNDATNGINEATTFSHEDEQNMTAEQEERNDFYSTIARSSVATNMLQNPAFFQAIHSMSYDAHQNQLKQQYHQRLVQHAETNIENFAQINTASASGMFGLWMTASEDSRSRLHKQVTLQTAFRLLEENNNVQDFVGELERLKSDPAIIIKRGFGVSKTLTYIENVLNCMPKNPDGAYLLDGMNSLEDLIQHNPTREKAINTLAEYVNLGPHYCDRMVRKKAMQTNGM
jgi:hypothetical protein